MTKKKQDNAELAKAAYRHYVQQLHDQLAGEDCPASVLAEARRFFEGQGITLEDAKGASPAQEEATNWLASRLGEMKQKSG